MSSCGHQLIVRDVRDGLHQRAREEFLRQGSLGSRLTSRTDDDDDDKDDGGDKRFRALK